MRLLDSLENLILEQTQSPILSYQRFQDPKIDESCKSKWQTELPKAVEYWKKWLNNPITKEKFKKNWNVDPKTNTVKGQNVDEIFQKYNSALDSLKLVFYNNSTKVVKDVGYDVSNPKYKDFGAFVSPKKLDYVFVNCSYDLPEKYAALVHEMQHTLYEIFPLNPDVKTQSLFVSKETKNVNPLYFFPKTVSSTEVPTSSSTDYRIFPTTKGLENMNVTTNMINTSKLYRIPIAVLESWKNKAESVKTQSKDPGYACRQNEKLSNISAIRKILDIQPGENITLEMLRPYIEFKKSDVDVFWLLLCWAENGFNSIDVFLKNLNDLAFQKTTKSDIQSV